MILPTLLTALVAGLCFGLRFRKLLGETYDPHILEIPESALHDRLVFWLSWGALLVLIIGYLVGGQLHLPISYIAGPVALAMMLLRPFHNPDKLSISELKRVLTGKKQCFQAQRKAAFLAFAHFLQAGFEAC